MRKFYKALLPIERLALLGAAIAAVILIWMGFIYPTAGVATLFMLGTLTAFWSIMTLVAAIARYLTAKKAEQLKDKNSVL